MDLRHLRCFVALAEELHFARAAKRMHIEQSPLSRTIKELEDELQVKLFERNRRGTSLTPAGNAFLQDVMRLLATLEHAKENVRAVAAGLRGSLRIAISDGAINPRLSTFLARCRAAEPEVEIRLSEVTLAEQLRGLRSGDFIGGLAHTSNVDDGIVAEPIWQDPLVLAVPARHELLAYREVPLHKLVDHPLILCNPQTCEGYCHEQARILRHLEHRLHVVEHVSSLDMMLTLVGAGYGVGFTTATRVASCHRPDVIFRPLSAKTAVVTTYLLWSESSSMPAPLERFIARLHGSLISDG